MKAFFEEYGFVMIAATVVLLLIVMTGPLGTTVETKINSAFNSVTTAAQDQLD